MAESPKKHKYKLSANTLAYLASDRSTRKPQENRLTPQQMVFVSEYLRTGEAESSARYAGYSQCGTMGRYLLNECHAVKKELEERRKEIRKATEYTSTLAMEEAKEAMAFAKLTENANAYVKAVELRSKLSGLLIDKLDARIGSFSIHIDGLDQPAALPPPADLVIEHYQETKKLAAANEAEEEEDMFS
jgi:hypothetical protein